jgi:hypothetical protein
VYVFQGFVSVAMWHEVLSLLVAALKSTLTLGVGNDQGNCAERARIVLFSIRYGRVT